MTTVVTLVRDRTDHLAGLVAGLDATTAPEVPLVVVQMGGEDPSPAWRRTPREVRHHRQPGGPLPLAAARNRGARAADDGPVVFLDVDCIPGPGTVRACERAVADRDVVVMGGVAYLGPDTVAPGDPIDPTDADELARRARPHPARPLPAAGLATCERPELFWSLSFAMRRATFLAVGGFDPGYVGYGGEDTDFARTLQAAGIPLAWVGDAVAYHQYHPSWDPPLPHVAAIVRNARRFHAKWGDWPMTGWLAAFSERGLVDWDPVGDRLERRRLPTSDELAAARRPAAVA